MNKYKYLKLKVHNYKGGELALPECYNSVSDCLESEDSFWDELLHDEPEIETIEEFEQKVKDVIANQFMEIYAGDEPARHIFKLHVEANKLSKIYYSKLLDYVNLINLFDQYKIYYNDQL